MQTKKVNTNKSKEEPLPRYIPQKSVRNECLQSLEIYFVKESGEVENYWLKPKEMIKIPSSGVTAQLRLLQERRMIKVINV